MTSPTPINHEISVLITVQVLDFGASRDGVPAHERGRRIVLNSNPVDAVAEEDSLEA